MNEWTNLLCLLFCFSQQTNQIRLFIFWENLWRANPAFGFILRLGTISMDLAVLYFLSYSTSYATLNVETTRCTTAASIVYIGITSKVLWWLFASVCEWKHTGCTICIIYIIQKIENFVHGYISAIKYQATFWVGWLFLSQFTQKKNKYS